MAGTYGFYNSINGDRTYSAEQMVSIFDGIMPVYWRNWLMSRWPTSMEYDFIVLALVKREDETKPEVRDVPPIVVLIGVAASRVMIVEVIAAVPSMRKARP